MPVMPRFAAFALLCAMSALAFAASPSEDAVQAKTPAAIDDPEFSTCVANRLRPQAIARGIPGADFDHYMAGISPDRSVLDLLNAQPEFTTAIWDYLAGLVDDERVADGRAMLETHRELLARVSAQYGVDAETIVAVWGVES